ncbi:unnamed protein product [Caenorhabditis nigoni]
MRGVDRERRGIREDVRHHSKRLAIGKNMDSSSISVTQRTSSSTIFPVVLWDRLKPSSSHLEAGSSKSSTSTINRCHQREPDLCWLRISRSTGTSSGSSPESTVIGFPASTVIPTLEFSTLIEC